MSTNNGVLKLVDALQQWCDPSLVQRIKDEECRCSQYQLDQSGLIQLSSREIRRQPTNTSWMGGYNLRALHAAWQDLERDLRQRIEQGLIILRGVLLAPEQQTELEGIPGVWAATFTFNFSKGTVRSGKRRYGAISCSRGPDIVCNDPVGAETSTIEGEPSATDQMSQQPVRSVGRPISFGVDANGERVTFGGGPILEGASAKVVWKLLPNFKAGLTADCGADGFEYMSDAQLADALGISGGTLRTRVNRLRAELNAQFLAQVKATLDGNDVIENLPWKGYRLNPHLALSQMLVNEPAVSQLPSSQITPM